MEIIRLKETSPEWKKAWELYTEAAARGEILYAAMDPDTFRDSLSCRTEGIRTVNLLEKDGHAFASGCLDKNSGKLFVTMVLVEEKRRRQGKGKEILSVLEHLLEEEKECPDTKTIFELSFFNPVTLTWEVPGLHGVTHPNAPGVDVGGMAYLFFKNCGYREFALQNSYYLNLKDFAYPERIRERKDGLAQEGVTFQTYDRRHHQGMETMLQEFGNPIWEREISKEPDPGHGGRPILVPVQGGQVLGFTGPLSVEPGGRGYFAGIAVSAGARGKGLGKLLFYELCRGLQGQGASYMTLFTGENNPARNIYEEAGFRIVRSWSDMRKQK